LARPLFFRSKHFEVDKLPITIKWDATGFSRTQTVRPKIHPAFLTNWDHSPSRILGSGSAVIAFVTYFAEKHEDLWKWHNGVKVFLETKYALRPTHWSALQREVREPDVRLVPPFGRDNPHFLLLFLLVAPHRLNPTTAMILEQIDWQSGK